MNFVFLVLIGVGAAHFVSKRDANSVLDVPESYQRKRRFLGKSISSIKKKWNTVCKFNSVEKWDEFKDELEETSLPEKEVDRLESCTFKCARKDEALDFVGKAYEENREKQEEKEYMFVPACEGCFKHVPKSGHFTFSKKCKNRESLFGLG